MCGYVQNSRAATSILINPNQDHGERTVTIAISKAERGNGESSSEVSRLIADVEELLTKVAHVADQDVTTLRERLRQKISAARESVSTGTRRAGRMASTATTSTDEYVHQSPWQSIGIAALVGATVGYLLARR